MNSAHPTTPYDGAHESAADDPIPSTERVPALGARIALDFAVGKLDVVEQRVLTRIAERLAVGQASYGPLDLARDPRAFRSREAREEIEEALVYLACAWLKAEEQTA